MLPAVRTLRLRMSAVLAAVLACAQLVAAVGRPVVGPVARCVCESPTTCAAGGCGCPVPDPEPAAECCGCCGDGPVRCGTQSGCCSKPAGGTWRVDWLASLEAGGCRKAPPAGTTPAEPSVPPAVPVEVLVLTPGEPVMPARVRPASVPVFPPDPPPRRTGR